MVHGWNVVVWVEVGYDIHLIQKIPVVRVATGLYNIWQINNDK